MDVTVPIYRHRLLPGTGDSSGHIYSWIVCDSESTEVFPVGATNGDKHRTIRWEPGGKYAERKETWARRWQRVVKGSPARFFNFHTHPADDPDGYLQTGVDGTYRTGVSPVAFDWKEGAVQNWQGSSYSGFMLVTQPNERGTYKGSPHGNRIHWPILTDDQMRALRAAGRGFMYETRIVWGFADTNPPGGVTVWLYDDTGKRIETPVVDAQRINTRWLNEGMITLWEGGGYWNIGLNQEVVTENAPAQVGRTRDEMLADTPRLYSHWGTGTMDQNGTFTYGGSVVPPDPPPAITSSINDGDLVQIGDKWSVVVTPPPTEVEFWADGTRIAADPSAPFETTILLEPGNHQLGVAATINGKRHVFGTGGVFANIQVVGSTDPLGLRIRDQNSQKVTLEWTPQPDQEGFIPTLDGSEKLTDGKRHPNTSETQNWVTIGKKQDGAKHRYGVKIVGKIAEGSVEV